MEVRTEADAVLRDIEELAQTRPLPIIGPVKARYLIETVRKFKAIRVLEVGTLIGYSAIVIAQNLPANGKVITIEINPRAASRAMDNISHAKLMYKIEVIVGDALKVIPKIHSEFDMIFLDAAKNEYLQYMKLAENKLKKGGVVFADNAKIFAEDLQDYLEYVRESGKYRSEYIDVGFDGVEISEKL